MRSPRPMLVTGAHRSGSTWVGNMLTLSGEAGYIKEPFHLGHRPGVCAAKFAYWFQYVGPHNEADYRAALARTLRFSYDYAAELRALRSPRDVARMIRDASHFANHRRRGARALMKDPVAFFSAEWLADRFGMDVVVLIRHPAAFASSLQRLGWAHDFTEILDQPRLIEAYLAPFADEIRAYAANPPDVIDQATLLWRLFYHTARHHYQERHPEWHFVRHEDLSRAPVAAFEKLYTALGLNFTPEVRKEIGLFTGQHNPAEAETGVAHQLKRDSRANIFNWKQRLSNDEITRIRRQVADVAPHFYGEEDW